MSWTKLPSQRSLAILVSGILSSACHRGSNSSEASGTQSDKYCPTIVAGQPSLAPLPLALSNMHATLRFFSSNPNYRDVDQSLAAAVKGHSPLKGAADLAVYASRLVDTCLLDAREETLPAARVDVANDVATIYPGSGHLTLPPSLRAAIIDMRQLPHTDDLEQALAEAIASVSVSSMPRAEHKVRDHYGLTDEVSVKDNIYSNDVSIVTRPAITGTHASDLPLVVITGESMPPAAAEFALTLRLNNRAWLVGSPVHASVAESSWKAVGSQGVMFRTGEFLTAGKRWPDKVMPDMLLEDLSTFVRDLSAGRKPADLLLNEGTRAKFLAIEPFGDKQPPGDAQADLRAALVVAHGAIGRFFPQYEAEKTAIDARYLKVLAIADQMAQPDPRWSRQVLRRLGESLKDGHNFVNNYRGSQFLGVLPIITETIQGKAVIRRSGVSDIHPGDTIDLKDGVLMSDWFAEELQRTSGDTLGYRYDIASRELIGLYGPTTLTLSAPDGTKRDVVVNPYPGDAYMKLTPGTPVLRPSGWLSDIHAPNIYYINLSSDVTKDIGSFDNALSEAKTAKGLVIDMRGYPNGEHYEMASKLICQDFKSPAFHIPTYSGPASRDTNFSQMALTASSDAFCGPIVLLVGPHSVSAAENFSTMLVDAKRVTVVGQQSAGTNGNITGVQLPGNFGFTFTGMEVRHADGTAFKGIGIVPDVLAEPTVEDMSTGEDRALTVAAGKLQP